jgi:hypothetical protein
MTLAASKASPFAAEFMGMVVAGRLSAIVPGIEIERPAAIGPDPVPANGNHAGLEAHTAGGGLDLLAVAPDRRQRRFDLDLVSRLDVSALERAQPVAVAADALQ